MARRDKHQLGRALAISLGLHLAVLSLQFGLSGKYWPALGWNWGERAASVPLPSQRVELRAGSVEITATPSSPLPVQLPVARTTATPDMPQTLIVTLLPPPQPAPTPTPIVPPPAPQALPPTLAPAPMVHKKIRGKKGSPILSVARASSDEKWVVPPMATGDQSGKKNKEEPSSAPPEAAEPTRTHTPTPQEAITPSLPSPPSHTAAETEAQTRLREQEQEQQTLRARERAEQEQRQLAERAEAERIAARALQRQKEEAEARAQAQADEVRRKAEQEALAKKAAEEAARAEAAALRQRAEAQAKEAQERAREKARLEQERLRLAAERARAEEEKRKAMEAERLAEEQRREAEKQTERRKAEAQAAAEAQALAEAQAKAQAEAAARAAREAAARYQQEQQAQQALASERARAAAAANANAAATAGKNDTALAQPSARKGASLATQALDLARRGGDTSPVRTPVEKDNPLLPERHTRSSVLGRNPNEIQLSFYSDSWEEKIRRIGNINYPRVSRDSAYGSVVVSVRIRNDGSLESVSIVKSSGNRELDQAARRIIEMCAPFSAFPPDLRRSFDVIEVRRTLTFPDHPPLFITQ